MPQFVVLLRGVNVGKANRLPMAEFAEGLRGLGYSDVKTVLNSGNAVFTAKGTRAAKHAETIAGLLKASFSIDTPVLVVPAADFSKTITQAPITPPEADQSKFLLVFAPDAESLAKLAQLQPLLRPNERFARTDVAGYLHCAGGLLESKFAAVLLGKAWRQFTTRNWATAQKIAALLG
jgi:uncharacterized protein (DUF1697 family)